ncbi:MAG: hypothetical protein IT424_09450 [Pirellulales bacterium]|nr:hypothetical protein [Pirellulales bacterium]
MIISHQHRYLFIEVPHTATTAIASELRACYAGERILDKHAKYPEFLRQASADERKYFVFAGVRNPLDIVVTEFYKYRSNHRGAFTDLAGRGKWVTPLHQRQFRFVTEVGDFAAYLRRFYRRVYHNWYLVGHRRFNKVLRFESIASDFAQTLGELGLTPVRPLPTSNQSARPRQFADLYTAETARLAAHTFGPFMRQWGYEFPQSWGAVEPSRYSQAAFRLAESAVNWTVEKLPISGRGRSVQWARRLLAPVA